ncbi:MAG: hypothetical protein JW795_07370 [Chitinivibrionales bacterium]|nr:hypothetical protein [Chitinivibrionales bacterium]
MQYCLSALLIVVVLHFYPCVAAQTCTDAAMEQLSNRSEVYFRFFTDSRIDLKQVLNAVSVDRIEGSRIYAYANKSGFEQFLRYDIEYELLTPPSLIGEYAPGSDYHDFTLEGSSIDKFPTYEGYIKLMEDFAKQAPDKCRLVDAALSPKGRRVVFAVISDKVTEDEAEPKVILTSTMHGDETWGFIINLKLIQHLLANYGKDAQATRIIDSVELWINPNHNPDGTYNSSNGQSQQGATRGNGRTQDLNRNYPGPTQSEGKDLSNSPEVVGIMNIEKKERFCLGIDGHGGMQTAVIPWGYSTAVTADDATYRYLGKMLYSQVIAAGKEGPYTASGSRFDWPYFGYGGRVVCLEYNTSKPLSESQFSSAWNQFYQGHLKLIEEALNGIRGTVTDSKTKQGIVASVALEKTDDQYGTMKSYPVHGDFYHPAVAGTYTVKITPENTSHYDPQTLTNVTVTNGKPTILSITMNDKTTSINTAYEKFSPPVIVSRSSTHYRVAIKTPWYPLKAAYLYSMRGTQISSSLTVFAVSSGESIIEVPRSSVANGPYILGIACDQTVVGLKLMLIDL